MGEAKRRQGAVDSRPYQINAPTEAEAAFMKASGRTHNSGCRSYRFGRQPQGPCDCGADTAREALLRLAADVLAERARP